ncbi:hypothetical protein EXIGLDRAFT_727786 [Exidia glandulosa HHB12029]|uniref:Uncharacterized protein n=1 Tax=Exidia glandulosa HHB12029 TaxID=1314781 RepID=A0A165D785_EXIGL|nr:hypothetical protein EXIGLDRAFT_727786 [Exidia glandulosa HHB12029]
MSAHKRQRSDDADFERPAKLLRTDKGNANDVGLKQPSPFTDASNTLAEPWTSRVEGELVGTTLAKTESRQAYWLQKLQTKTATLMRRLPWSSSSTTTLLPKPATTARKAISRPRPLTTSIHPSRPAHETRTTPSFSPPSAPAQLSSDIPEPARRRNRNTPFIRFKHRDGTSTVKRVVFPSLLGPNTKVKAMACRVLPTSTGRLPCARTVEPDLYRVALQQRWMFAQPAFSALDQSDSVKVFQERWRIRKVLAAQEQIMQDAIMQKFMELRVERDLAQCGFKKETRYDSKMWRARK